jgi:hypothetical protein
MLQECTELHEEVLTDQQTYHRIAEKLQPRVVTDLVLQSNGFDVAK